MPSHFADRSRSRRQNLRGPLVALGIVSAPLHAERRGWLRRLMFAAENIHVAHHFVLGTHLEDKKRLPIALGAAARRDLDEEQRNHRDLLWLNVTEGLVTGCIEKSFGWWAHATRAHPSAAFIAKTDDDAFVDLPSLVRLLRAVRAEPGSPLVYGGWLQWTSWFERRYFGCGWATSPLDALRERQGKTSNCARCQHCFVNNAPRPTREPINLTVVGPYPFAVGALEVMSGALAARVFGSPWVRSYVRDATRDSATVAHAQRDQRWGAAHSPRRRSSAELGGDGHSFWQRELTSWHCRSEDASVGLMVHAAAADLEVRLLALNDYVQDTDLAWQEERLWPAARLRCALRELLVVHKLEWSEAEMRRREALEDAGNVRLVQLGIPNVTHQHVRARLSRRVVAALGAAAAPAAPCGHESALARPRVRCERQPTAGALPGLPGWTRCVVEQKRRRGPPARLCIPFCELPAEPGAPRLGQRAYV